MRNRSGGRVLQVALASASACWLLGCEAPVSTIDEGDVAQADGGAPLEPAVFHPLATSAAFRAHDPGGPLEEAILPEGTFALGYVPTPVTIPQLDDDARPLAMVQLAALPSSFDLRKTGKLPPVRDQGGCGSCWTFATFASSESGLLPNEADDFSEDHLNNTHGFDILPCNGGNSLMSIAYLSRWSGPVAEADAPYTGAVHAYSKILPARKHLTDASILPDRTGPLDNEALKNAVTTYGAVYTTMNWTSAHWKGASNGYYNPGPVTNANHAVAIVGWNDDFAASSFPSAPAGKGAFLIRNSWGTSFGDAGYFWVSYYDVYIGKENVAFASYDPISDFDAAYQYDSYGQTSALGVASGTSSSANVFTAQAETNLQAVSFYTTAPSSQVTISVYDAPTAAPPSGTLSGTQASTQPHAGYHTVSLASLGIALHKGHKFSVVVKVTTPNAQSYVPVEYPFAGYSSKVVATAGTGFVSGNGAEWTDTAKTWKANVPIKAFVGAAPSCDDKNPCTLDKWDGGACTHTAAPAGTVCRASAGDCDVVETCTGSSTVCPADALKPAVSICRAANGACDVAETCTGASAACPADAKQKKGTACRPSIGVCDAAETCDGAASACPEDKAAPAGTVCRASAGDCDVAEACSGKSTSCPADAFKPSGGICRAAAGGCDVAETCSGKTASCPADALRPRGYVCSSSPVLSCSGTTKACSSK